MDILIFSIKSVHFALPVYVLGPPCTLGQLSSNPVTIHCFDSLTPSIPYIPPPFHQYIPVHCYCNLGHNILHSPARLSVQHFILKFKTHLQMHFKWIFLLRRSPIPSLVQHSSMKLMSFTITKKINMGISITGTSFTEHKQRCMKIQLSFSEMKLIFSLKPIPQERQRMRNFYMHLHLVIDP